MKIFLLRSVGISFFYLLLSVFYSCKKEKFITIEGKLLISNTNPVAVSNYKVYFFQPGSPGIPIAIYSSPSEGSTITDNNGNYSAKFKLGRSGFLIFQGSNTSSIDMSGEPSSNFPGFYIANIPSNGSTIYLYKKIDSAFLMLSSGSSGISANDSLTIRYHSTGGPVTKIKTGITVPAGTSFFAIDTISNVTLSYYDFVYKKYQNDIWIQLRKAGLPNSQSLHPALSDSIGPGDEQNKQLRFYMW